MNRRSKQIVFAMLSTLTLLIGVSECLPSSSVQASQNFGNQVTYPKATQPNQNPIPQPEVPPSSQLGPVLKSPETLILRTGEWDFEKLFKHALVLLADIDYQQVFKWIVEKLVLVGGAGALFCLVIYLGVLWLYPRGILRLPSTELKILKSPIKLPLEVTLWLKYQPRALDAWVSERIKQFQRNFELERDTVKDRGVHLFSVPVLLNGETISDMSEETLRKRLQPTFERRQFQVLIYGEGGTGKTSLACQIAKWAMANDEATWLCKHQMIPILIETDLEVTDAKPALLKEISRQLQNLREDEELVKEELLKQLLKKRRILIIVDHLSEMNPATQKAIQDLPEANLPINALIVTSRRKEVLNTGVTKTLLEPQRIASSQLLAFMDQYLTQLGKRKLFQDDLQYIEDFKRLSQIVTGQRSVTILFAKLYLDLMIAVAEGRAGKLPDNIPDLMLNYINQVNQEKQSNVDDRLVQQDLKIIAWECLKETLKPGMAKSEQVINSLVMSENENDTARESAKKRLKDLEERLSLVRTVPPAKTKIRFALDPLVEYLAGLHLVERYSKDEQMWRAFLEEVENKPSTLEEIQGFLLALRNCCIARVEEFNIPDFVIKELSTLGGIHPETLEREQLRRKIQRLKSDLDASDDKERVIWATQRVETISEDIKINNPEFIDLLVDVLPSLARLVKGEDEQPRDSARSTLAKIGSLAVPALVDLLKDEGTEVRQLAVRSLRQIPSEAQMAVPELITKLNNDPDATVRWNSAITLSKIVMVAKDKITIPPLVKALLEAFKNDSEVGVRSYSVFALGKLGSDAQEAIPIILDELSKEDIGDFNLFVAIVEALDAIGVDLDSIEVEIILDGIKTTPKKVVLDLREELHKKTELEKQSSKGMRLEWLPSLASFTPPQKDPYGTGADTPKWL